MSEQHSKEELREQILALVARYGGGGGGARPVETSVMAVFLASKVGLFPQLDMVMPLSTDAW
ncbi:hypothetical protein ACFDR9_004920, partial [Janthinobacterium sp. CG_23.3]